MTRLYVGYWMKRATFTSEHRSTVNHVVEQSLSGEYRPVCGRVIPKGYGYCNLETYRGDRALIECRSCRKWAKENQ